MTLEAPAGQKGHSVTSRGQPVRFQGDRGVRKFGMVMLGGPAKGLGYGVEAEECRLSGCCRARRGR